LPEFYRPKLDAYPGSPDTCSPDTRPLSAKAVNAGGVAVSGQAMAQNGTRLSCSHAEVDERLHAIRKDMHEDGLRHGRRGDGCICHVDGANIAGLVKVADAMLAQGVVRAAGRAPCAPRGLPQSQPRARRQS